jgi:cytochrome c oxidase assembly factor CtaG
MLVISPYCLCICLRIIFCLFYEARFVSKKSKRLILLRTSCFLLIFIFLFIYQNHSASNLLMIVKNKFESMLKEVIVVYFK